MECRRVFLKVARVGKPHGIRGENTVHVFNADVRLLKGQEFMGTFDQVFDPASEHFNFVINSVRRHHRSILVRFEGLNDRDEAEGLRNINLFLAEEKDPDDGDTWYEHQLLGFEVCDCLTEEPIGVVIGLQVLPAQDLLIVETSAGKEAMIPFVKPLVLDIDRTARRVVVSLPGGLLDVNP